MHIWHKRLDDWKQTLTKCRQDGNNAVQFLKTWASTWTSFNLPNHHFLHWLSQEPWFLPRQGSLRKNISISSAKLLSCLVRRISTIRHYLTDDATKTLVVSLVLSRIDYCNSLLAGLPQPLVGKLQSPKQCSPSCIPCTSTCSHHSSTQTSSLVACQSPNFL